MIDRKRTLTIKNRERKYIEFENREGKSFMELFFKRKIVKWQQCISLLWKNCFQFVCNNMRIMCVGSSSFYVLNTENTIWIEEYAILYKYLLS